MVKRLLEMESATVFSMSSGLMDDQRRVEFKYAAAKSRQAWRSCHFPAQKNVRSKATAFQLFIRNLRHRQVNLRVERTSSIAIEAPLIHVANHTNNLRDLEAYRLQKDWY